MVPDGVSHGISLLVGIGDTFWHQHGWFSCLWDWWRSLKECWLLYMHLCKAEVLLPSSCSCCKALMAGVLQWGCCGMSLVLQAPCCCTLPPFCRWSRSLFSFPIAKPPHLCCQLRLPHTWWATFLVGLSSLWPLRATGQWCCPWRLPQGKHRRFSGLY